MDWLISLGLPIALAVIMLSLGVGLEVSDFRRVLSRPRAFAVGAICQMVLLPVVAFTIVTALALPPEIAVGVMLLSLCPGGVTSNILSKLGGGDVALSVSLTAVISLLCLLTVPVLAAWSVRHFLGAAYPDVTIAGLAIALFLITTLPVLTGVCLRHWAPGAAGRIDRPLATLANALFVLILLAALAANWDIFITNLARMGIALVLLLVVLLLTGYAAARVAGLTRQEIRTITIETGIQNATLGVTLAGLITATTEGLSPLALPAGVYGILMYVIVLPLLAWFRASDKRGPA